MNDVDKTALISCDGYFEARTGTNQETSPIGKKPPKNPNRNFCEHLAVYLAHNLNKHKDFSILFQGLFTAHHNIFKATPQKEISCIILPLHCLTVKVEMLYNKLLTAEGLFFKEIILQQSACLSKALIVFALVVVLGLIFFLYLT